MSLHKLKNVAEIFTGYNFRSALNETPTSSLFVLQSKNLSDSLYINEKSMIRIEDEDFNTSAILRKDDVILSSRGSFRATVLQSDKNIIATSSVYIIRVKTLDLLPEFLAMYLNSTRGQSHLKQYQTGAVIKTVPIKNMGEIPVIYPDIQTQKKIIAFHINNIDLSRKLKEKSEIIRSLSDNLINSL